MSVRYILIQTVGLLGTALFFISFQCRDNRTLFRVQLVAYFLYTAHLLLLGAVTGGISYLINLIRSACLGSNWKFGRSKVMCWILCIMQMAVLFFTWAGWISILPVVANIAATVGGYTHNAKKIRLAGMLVNSPLWIVYSILVGSIAGVLDEVVSEISVLISIHRFGWKNLDQTEE